MRYINQREIDQKSNSTGINALCEVSPGIYGFSPTASAIILGYSSKGYN